MMASEWISDRVVLAAVRVWCYLRYPRLSLRTWKRSRVFPDPATPVSYSDKFLWRKIFDHDPRFITLCEKLAAKELALSACPELKTAAILWKGTDPAAIPARLLDRSVVVKANHGCAWNVLVQKGAVDVRALRLRAARWMGRRYGRRLGEWAYGKATRCIFIEEMLLENDQPIRCEYKFHVSSGRTAYVYAARRNPDGKEQKCHMEADGRICRPPPGAGAEWVDIPPPASFWRMKDIAERLAAPFDHMRCDFYEIGGQIYFSEFSVYPLSGQAIHNTRLSELCSADWDLRQSWFLTAPQTSWRRAYASALVRFLDERAWSDLRPHHAPAAVTRREASTR